MLLNSQAYFLSMLFTYMATMILSFPIADQFLPLISGNRCLLCWRWSRSYPLLFTPKWMVKLRKWTKLWSSTSVSIAIMNKITGLTFSPLLNFLITILTSLASTVLHFTWTTAITSSSYSTFEILFPHPQPKYLLTHYIPYMNILLKILNPRRITKPTTMMPSTNPSNLTPEIKFGYSLQIFALNANLRS